MLVVNRLLTRNVESVGYRLLTRKVESVDYRLLTRKVESVGYRPLLVYFKHFQCVVLIPDLKKNHILLKLYMVFAVTLNK